MMNPPAHLADAASAVHRTMGTPPEQWTPMDHAVALRVLVMVAQSNAIYDESTTDEQGTVLHEAREEMADQFAAALGVDPFEAEQLAWDRWQAAGRPLN